ncbi:MAG: hypothetical protein ACPHID_03550 [Thermoplasmatota archaeon]
MDPLTAALLAGLVAWGSIFLVARAPSIPVDVQGLRRVGAATIAVLGLQVLGVPIPASAPLLILLGGVVAVVQIRGAAAA